MKNISISGIPFSLFLPVFLITLTAVYLDVLPSGLPGAIPLMMVLGALLNEAGNRTPIIKDFFGGGPIVVIFGSAALFYLNGMPSTAYETCRNFMKGGGFLNFYIAALITGSILGMNRKLLIRAFARYIPAILGGVALAIALTGLTGALIGYGAKKAILYIAIPIVGGGMGAGAVPLSEIFGESLGEDPTQMLSVMIPALALGNALSIVVAGLLDKLGRLKPALTGNGRLMATSADTHLHAPEIESAPPVTVEMLGHGMLLATAAFLWGGLLAKFIPIHPYALMILSVALAKACGWIPEQFEQAAFRFFRFIMVNLTPALLVGIGVAYTDLDAVIAAFSGQYLLLVTTTVAGVTIGSALVGKLVGFYPVESAITAGLCMSNMGGTGDVAVLSAAKRMELMPFAQISSRLGGAFIILLATALLRLLF